MRRVDIGWIRVFCEVARSGSLSAAAAALNITQPAVSYQMRRAESEFGCALVRRRSRGIELTPEGRAAYEVLSRAAAQIDDLALQLRPVRNPDVLRLFTDYAFSSLWLMPRLHHFRAAFPDCDLQIIASQHSELDQMTDGDLAVVFRPRGELGENAQLFIPEAVVPVCAPELVTDAASANLPDVRLVHLDGPRNAPWLNWRDYLTAFGIARDLRSEHGNLRFNTYSLVIEAVLSGQGVALGWRGLIERYLQSGRLVAVGGELTMQDRGYFLVRKGPAGGVSAALHDWLMSE